MWQVGHSCKMVKDIVCTYDRELMKQGREEKKNSNSSKFKAIDSRVKKNQLKWQTTHQKDLRLVWPKQSIMVRLALAETGEIIQRKVIIGMSPVHSDPWHRSAFVSSMCLLPKVHEYLKNKHTQAHTQSVFVNYNTHTQTHKILKYNDTLDHKLMS